MKPTFPTILIVIISFSNLAFAKHAGRFPSSEQVQKMSKSEILDQIAEKEAKLSEALQTLRMGEKVVVEGETFYKYANLAQMASTITLAGGLIVAYDISSREAALKGASNEIRTLISKGAHYDNPELVESAIERTKQLSKTIKPHYPKRGSYGKAVKVAGFAFAAMAAVQAVKYFYGDPEVKVVKLTQKEKDELENSVNMLILQLEVLKNNLKS
ncbi:MAG: hypothetical protein AB7F43_11525 [Bacteriovoracia bacterium]